MWKEGVIWQIGENNDVFSVPGRPEKMCWTIIAIAMTSMERFYVNLD